MIRTIIIDDELKSIHALKMLLNDSRTDIELIGEAMNAPSAIDLISKSQPNLDLVLLDIELPFGDGFSILQRLEKIDFNVIFITAYDQFAIKAIKFSALDYILKPVDPFELHAAIDKLKLGVDRTAFRENEFRKKIPSKTYFNKLAVTTLTDILFIELDRIIYLESDKNYTTIYIDRGEKIVSSKNIGYYEELLSDQGFCRIHNSFMVNVSKMKRYIKGRNGLLELDNGVTLEVSSRRKDQLFELLNLR